MKQEAQQLKDLPLPAVGIRTRAPIEPQNIHYKIGFAHRCTFACAMKEQPYQSTKKNGSLYLIARLELKFSCVAYLNAIASSVLVR